MSNNKNINELFRFEKGSLQSSKNVEGKYTFITASETWKTHESYSHDCEAIVIAVAASGSLGRTHYIKGKFIASDLCFILTEKDPVNFPVDLGFYFHIFNIVKDDLVKKTATGTSKLAINKTNFGNYKIQYFNINSQTNLKNK
ncbi:MAG: restriction endonuclease subunit S, partial [Candidatus Roizmanbacteria bacterium]|nr:restriction endonuclease subunit S [Candidatus Roizmanbacteria bacterium]